MTVCGTTLALFKFLSFDRFDWLSCIIFAAAHEDDSYGFHNPNTLTLPWSCSFGLEVESPEMCGFVQDYYDDFDWVPNENDTPTEGTGPPEEFFRRHGQ